MKTDRFDEEFRRKLLGLPAEVDPGEVERIQRYVHANKPALPGPGWGKLWLYAGSSLVLIGSLSYNVLQHYRNTRLHTSLDSLAHQSTGQTIPTPVIRHDTVYLTQSGAAKGRAVAGQEAIRSITATTPTAPNLPAEYPGQLRTQEVAGAAASSPTASPGQSAAETVSPVTGEEPVITPASSNVGLGAGNHSTVGLSPASRSGNRRRSKVRPSMSLPAGGHGQLAGSYARKQGQQTASTPSMSGGAATTTTSVLADELAPEPTRRTITVAVNPLASRQLIVSPTQPVVVVPGRLLMAPETTSSALATRRPWQLTLPALSMPSAQQYRIGGGFTAAGDEQLGGALLGEAVLNRHWSVQAGLRLAYSQGFHYRDEQEFDKHQSESFRQTYASQVPLSSTIEDIRQTALLIQLPLQVAYHYPLGRHWGLRLGFGTDLNLWVRGAVNYTYRENSRSAERSLARLDEPVHVVNNLTLNPGVERSWKNWLFRAGPSVGYQLRTVSYQPARLSWGATIQIMHRLCK